MRLLLLVALLGCTASPADLEVGQGTAAVVYGRDDRVEVHAHPDARLRRVAEEAVAVQVPPSRLDVAAPGGVRFPATESLAEAAELCPGERFEDQPVIGVCTGTLIDRQHLLTAAHCLEVPGACGTLSWVFGLRYARGGELVPVPHWDVYACDAVVVQQNAGPVDYAVVRLDRPVVGREPAALSASLPRRGAAVALVGHPQGLPMKIDSGGRVTEVDPAGRAFSATLDAFRGSSGSGVFTHDGTLVGVLESGMTDYRREGDCNVVNVIDPPPVDAGEGVTALGPVLAAFCAARPSSTACDCGGVPCGPAPDHDRCDDARLLVTRSQEIAGTLAGHSNAEEGSCGGAGPDEVYALTTRERGVRLQAELRGVAGVLYARQRACRGEELACAAAAPGATSTSLDLRLAPFSSAFLFVDARTAMAGDYVLDLQVTLDAAPVPDAGTVEDAGVPSDLGPPADLGPPSMPAADAGPPAPDATVVTLPPPTMTPGDGAEAAGCAAGASPAAAGALALLLLGLRRRRARP
ncbi:MAG: serine protease [Myxococcota bacterium]